MRLRSPVGALLMMGLVGSAPACAGPADEPLESGEDQWEAQSVTESGQSTHLWLVESALDILGHHEDLANARAARTLMLEATCKARWQQGLFDADFLHEYNNGKHDLEPGASTVAMYLSGATWKSHFFDADTGLNYKGEASPTARTEAVVHLDRARASLAIDRTTSCYELGLAIHFLTDVTQTMHAANYTALDRPWGMHSNVETWAMEIQEGFRVTDWSAAPAAGTDAETFIVQTARASKGMWQHSFELFADAYEASPDRSHCGSLRVSAWNFANAQRFDRPACWNGNPVIKEDVGQSLRRAQDLTAQFLYIVAGLETAAAAAL